MTTDRAYDNLIARCVAIVARYRGLEKSWPVWASMVAEIREIIVEADSRGVHRELIPPALLVELERLYARRTADRLHREFARMIAALPDPRRDWIRTIAGLPLKSKRLDSIRPSAAGIPARPRPDRAQVRSSFIEK